MVIIESLSPNEYSKVGPKLNIVYNIQNTIFGNCLIAVVQDSKNSICHLAFIGENDKEKGLTVMKEKWHLSNVKLNKNKDAKSVIDSVFYKISKNSTNDIRVLLKGTDFQIAVWKALTQIPCGLCATYEQVAEMIDNPRAARAVGNALAANQVCYLIPCHRVICKNGQNKFSCGITVKEKMQNFEKDLKNKNKVVT